MFLTVLLVIQNGLIFKGSVLHPLKFRGLSFCSHTGFLTTCGHLKIMVCFALPPYLYWRAPTSCMFLFSSENVLVYFLPVRQQDDVPGSCINSCLHQDVRVKVSFAFRPARDALEEGESCGHAGKQVALVGHQGDQDALSHLRLSIRIGGFSPKSF